MHTYPNPLANFRFIQSENSEHVWTAYYNRGLFPFWWVVLVHAALFRGSAEDSSLPWTHILCDPVVQLNCRQIPIELQPDRNLPPN
jgi:hypothetical protein